jgi:deoxyribodipyrimidine photo-lyase
MSSRNLSSPIVIHWFRQDLRLADNPALSAAAAAGQVLPIYIFEQSTAPHAAMGAASRCWLHHTLHALQQTLEGKLAIFAGDPLTILRAIIQHTQASAVYWNRCYEPWRIARDKQIKQALLADGVQVHSDKCSLLWEPWEVLKADGTPYKVFTPFYRKGCLRAHAPRTPLPAPANLIIHQQQHLPAQCSLEELALLPKLPWGQSMMAHWQVGEVAAQQRLQQFLQQGLSGYKNGRNFPSQSHVSRLSPHLHWGEISPNQVWYAAKQTAAPEEDIAHFQSELAWREFSYSLLYHFPNLPEKNLQTKFEAFPWHEDAQALSRWQQGQTGYPIVDAGMRELWLTGYMHNRVRMIVGSFLVKNLLLPWQQGAAWFWDCLVDADLANNSASWQWVAGSGADAAPYFRIFNPILQGQKFDAQGDYTRHYVPELAKLPDKYLFSPWEAPDKVLAQAGVVLGETYPQPMVDVKVSRERALAAYQVLRDAGKNG